MKESSVADERAQFDGIFTKSDGIYRNNGGIFAKSAAKLRSYTVRDESFHPWQSIFTPMTDQNYTL